MSQEQNTDRKRRMEADLDALFERDEDLVKKELLVEMGEDAGLIEVSEGRDEDPNFEDHWKDHSFAGEDDDEFDEDEDF